VNRFSNRRLHEVRLQRDSDQAAPREENIAASTRAHLKFCIALPRLGIYASAVAHGFLAQHFKKNHETRQKKKKPKMATHIAVS
jgi:hypothetical protein